MLFVWVILALVFILRILRERSFSMYPIQGSSFFKFSRDTIPKGVSVTCVAIIQIQSGDFFPPVSTKIPFFNLVHSISFSLYCGSRLPLILSPCQVVDQDSYLVFNPYSCLPLNISLTLLQNQTCVFLGSPQCQIHLCNCCETLLYLCITQYCY